MPRLTRSRGRTAYWPCAIIPIARRTIPRIRRSSKPSPSPSRPSATGREGLNTTASWRRQNGELPRHGRSELRLQRRHSFPHHLGHLRCEPGGHGRAGPDRDLHRVHLRHRAGQHPLEGPMPPLSGVRVSPILDLLGVSRLRVYAWFPPPHPQHSIRRRFGHHTTPLSRQ